MKKFNVWAKGPYSMRWEKLTAVSLDKHDAAIFGAEKSSGTAAVKVCVIPAGVDPNDAGGSGG